MSVPETPNSGNTYVFKVILAGDGAVGKTNLRRRFMGDSFVSEYINTVGADFAYYSEEVEEEEGLTTYKFSIWDLAGQPKFSNVRPVFYAGAMGALLCFDSTRKETFENLNKWLDELIRHTHTEGTPIVIVATKMDIYDPAKHMDFETEVREYIKKVEERLDHRFDVSFVETSSISGLNVKKAFHILRKGIMKWIKSDEMTYN